MHWSFITKQGPLEMRGGAAHLAHLRAGQLVMGAARPEVRQEGEAKAGG